MSDIRIVEEREIFGVPNQVEINTDDLPKILAEHKGQPFRMMYYNLKTYRPYINNGCKAVSIDDSGLRLRFCRKVKTLQLEQICHVIFGDTLYHLW